jgi:acetyl-CoA C-acetyltransferase
MPVEPRTPVIVGVGQTDQRVEDPTEGLEPIDLLAGAARAAIEDAGAARTLRVDTIGVVQIISWSYADPGALLGRRLGLGDMRATAVTTVGGNSPQLLLSTLAADIARGDADVVLMGGGECMRTRWRARREPKVWLPWTTTEDPPCPRVLGDDRPGSSEYEVAHRADAPIHVYPLLETALRAAAGRTVTEHQRHVGELWSTFAAVAATNPHAWSRTAYTPAEIVEPTPDNRLVTFPYTKRMCANMGVDQAAALVLCSYEAARAAGVPEERMVFPLSGADAHDHFFFTTRDRLDEAPGMAAAATAACEAAGVTIDDIARFDLYSCFPSAVELAMAALGLEGRAGGDDRPLTVTGGLAFAGGPTNDYPTHAIAAMVDACRADPGSVGYVSALGWFATKHSVGLYSTTPPARGFARVDPSTTQAAADATPTRAVAGAYDGPADIEATAVLVERDGRPSVAVVSAITPDGRRALANTADPDMLASMMDEAWEGRTVELTTDGATNELRG